MLQSHSPFISKVLCKVLFCNGTRGFNYGQEIVVRRLISVFYDFRRGTEGIKGQNMMRGMTTRFRDAVWRGWTKVRTCGTQVH